MDAWSIGYTKLQFLYIVGSLCQYQGFFNYNMTFFLLYKFIQ